MHNRVSRPKEAGIMNKIALLAAMAFSCGVSANAAELNKKIGPMTGQVQDLRTGRTISTCHRVTFKDKDGKLYVRDQDCPGHEGLGSIAYPADGCMTWALCHGQANGVMVYTNAHGVRRIRLYIK